MNFGFNCCHIFGGGYLGTDVTFDYRPNGTYEFRIEDNRAHFSLPSGSATVHAVNATVTVNFTPDMNLTTQAEYDNVSHHLDVLAIYNWQYSPGQTVLASVGNDALTTGDLLVPHYVQRSLSVLLRIGHTFQF